MKEKEHPLITAVRLKRKAQKSGAHPKVIANLERIISKRTSDILDGENK